MWNNREVTLDLRDVSVKYLKSTGTSNIYINSYLHVRTIDISNWALEIVIDDAINDFGLGFLNLNLGSNYIDFSDGMDLISRRWSLGPAEYNLILDAEDNWYEYLRLVDNKLGLNGDDSLLKWFKQYEEDLDIKGVGNCTEIIDRTHHFSPLNKQCKAKQDSVELLMTKLEDRLVGLCRAKGIKKYDGVTPSKIYHGVRRYGDNTNLINILLINHKLNIVTKSKYERMQIKAKVLMTDITSCLVIND